MKSQLIVNFFVNYLAKEILKRQGQILTLAGSLRGNIVAQRQINLLQLCRKQLQLFSWNFMQMAHQEISLFKIIQIIQNYSRQMQNNLTLIKPC